MPISPVTALHELCSKQHFAPPVYEFTTIDGAFQCIITFITHTGFGEARSKREAKRLAAADLLKVLKAEKIPMEGVKNLENTKETPAMDMVVALRDYCVSKYHPLPKFEIVTQCGEPHAPSFTAICSVASVKRYCNASTKKEARQRVALKVLTLISDIADTSETELAERSAAVATVVEEERYQKFNTYRQLCENGSPEDYKVALSDRHMFFKKFHPHLRDGACEVLSSSERYGTKREQAEEILKVLKIVPEIGEVKGRNETNKITVDLRLEYEVIFIGDAGGNDIWVDIIEYFDDMLH